MLTGFLFSVGTGDRAVQPHLALHRASHREDHNLALLPGNCEPPEAHCCQRQGLGTGTHVLQQTHHNGLRACATSQDLGYRLVYPFRTLLYFIISQCAFHAARAVLIS